MSYTSDFAYVSGQYSFAGQCTPYYCVVLSASEAINVFKLARETIMDPTSVSLDELFQRQVNKRRVKSELVPYLSRPGTLKFFGPLIVALLPFEDGRLRDQFDDETNIYYSEEKSAYVSQIGPVRITQVDDRSGFIGWELDKVAAVVIDGQHRFSAIRALSESDLITKDQELATTQIPVSLLLLDHRIGYQGDEKRILQAVRRVFVDLNRHAEPVSEARSILLDDFDVVCVLTRQLFGRTAGHSSENAEPENKRLPLALVDWYSEKAKFDTGIHLTTVLCLHSIVKDLLLLPTFDNEDVEQCTRYIDKLCAPLPVKIAEALRIQLAGVLSDSQSKGQSFSIPPECLETVKNWFRDSWAIAISNVLQKIGCYAELIRTLRQNDVIGGLHEVWAALDEEGKAAYLEAQSSPFNAESLTSVVNAHKQTTLFFQVVFQKGLIQAFTQFHLHNSKDIMACPIESGEKFADLFNKRINRLSRDFWLGAGLRFDGRIAWNKSSQNAISSAILTILTAPIDEWLGLPKEAQHDALKGWIDNITQAVLKRKKVPDEHKAFAYRIRTWRDSLARVIKDTKKLQARSDFATTEEISELLINRFQSVLEALEPCASS